MAQRRVVKDLTILRTPSNNTTSTNEIRRTCGIDASRTTKCPQPTQGHTDERL
uniref:HTH_48 domain-containing protein n=1 Tax=Heterorhabditis bacteriophora TaxID=37862 RepID=A0A1I7WLJ9_HETBA